MILSYVLKKTIILLEFSYYNGVEEYNQYYHQKFSQVIRYQTLLSNIIDSSIKVVPYVFLYKPEYERFGFDIKWKVNQVHQSENNKKLKDFSEVIKKLYIMDTTGVDELVKLKEL